LSNRYTYTFEKIDLKFTRLEIPRSSGSEKEIAEETENFISGGNNRAGPLEKEVNGGYTHFLKRVLRGREGETRNLLEANI